MDAVQLMGEAILPRRYQCRDAGGASAGHFVVQADEHVLSLDAPVVGERPFEAAAERPGRLRLALLRNESRINDGIGDRRLDFSLLSIGASPCPPSRPNA